MDIPLSTLSSATICKERGNEEFSFIGHECWITHKNEKPWILLHAMVVAENVEQDTMMVQFMDNTCETVSRNCFFTTVPTKQKYLKECMSTVPTTHNSIDEQSGHSLLRIHGISKDQVQTCISRVLSKHLAPFAFNVGLFFLFMYERQLVWQRKNSGVAPPFTQNVVMDRYFFCNNYRELDRGTNYFHAQVVTLFEKYSQHGGLIQKDLWVQKILWASICYRLVNKVETFLRFGGIPESDKWPGFQTYFRHLNTTRFTGAHQTMGARRYLETMNGLYKSKQTKILANKIIQYSQASQLEKCVKVLEKIQNVGRFLAWQITCDLLESKCLSPCDENDYALLGKGANVGINLIFVGEIKVHKHANGLQFARLLREKCDDVYQAMGITFPKFHGRPITLKHIEHALCEYQKFISITEQYEREVTPSGQRTTSQLRSHLDLQKACHYCHGTSDDIILCDFCSVAYCPQCVIFPVMAESWMCQSCSNLELIRFE